SPFSNSRTMPRNSTDAPISREGRSAGGMTMGASVKWISASMISASGDGGDDGEFLCRTQRGIPACEFAIQRHTEIAQVRIRLQAEQQRARGVAGAARQLLAGEAEDIPRLREGEDGDGHRGKP